MSDLPAGRELDALVAEKVMGCFVAHGRASPTGSAGSPGSDLAACSNRDHGHWGNDVPFYSSSISAAWEVVEYMARLAQHGSASGYAATIDSITLAGGEVRWWVRFRPIVWMASALQDATPEAPHEVHSWHKSAPLAICRAALLAVGAT